MPPVQVPTYQDAYNQLGSVYDPQTSSVNTQLAGLQPLQDAQQSGLDQAKVNAFRDITQGANAKGVMFSGVPIDQQAQYVGTKYLPAVANLKQTFANQRTTLLDKINQINAQRANQAQGIVSDAQKNATDAAYKNTQLQLDYAKLNASRANSASSASNKADAAAAKLASQYKVTTFGSGNYKFTGPNGRPTNLAGYLDGIGGGVSDLKQLLANGSKYDKTIYSQVKGLNDPAKIAATIAKLDKQNFYGFQ